MTKGDNKKNQREDNYGLNSKRNESVKYTSKESNQKKKDRE